MDKRLIYPQNLHKERDLFLVKEDRNYLRKHASGYHPEIASYIEKAKPLNGLIQVLLTALGATPYWPQNVNADDFPVSALSHRGDDYGYETFQSNANYFTHHVNKDPALAKGKVLHSVWNDGAKRVELIVGIDPNLDPDAQTMVDNGESLCFSMGAKLPFDMCTICLNRAKTRADYCDHLRYQLNQIDPETGKLVGAINHFPKFFDISRVLIPADKTAYMWEKIAAAGPRQNVFSKLGSAHLADLPVGRLADMKYLEKVAEERSEKHASVNKKATVHKRAEIQKRIIAIQPQADAKLSRLLPRVKEALDQGAPSITPDMLAGVQSLKEALITMLTLGMTPTRAESKTLFDVFTGKPEGIHQYSPTLASRLAPLIPQRSFAGPVLVKRIQILLASPTTKTAAQMTPRIYKQEAPSDFEVGLKKGILTALAFLMAPPGLRDFVMNHPIPLLLAGAPLIAAGRVLTSKEPLVSGEYDLAGPSNSIYNDDWRSRFAQMQARPVTVIKTGEDLSQASQNVLSHWSGISGLIGLSDLWYDGSDRAVSVFDNQFPALLKDSILSKSAQEIGEVSHLLKTATSLSGERPFSLDDLPQTDRTASADLLVISLAEKLIPTKGER